MSIITHMPSIAVPKSMVDISAAKIGLVDTGTAGEATARTGTY